MFIFWRLVDTISNVLIWASQLSVKGWTKMWPKLSTRKLFARFPPPKPSLWLLPSPALLTKSHIARRARQNMSLLYIHGSLNGVLSARVRCWVLRWNKVEFPLQYILNCYCKLLAKSFQLNSEFHISMSHQLRNWIQFLIDRAWLVKVFSKTLPCCNIIMPRSRQYHTIKQTRYQAKTHILEKSWCRKIDSSDTKKMPLNAKETCPKIFPLDKRSFWFLWYGVLT